MKPRAIMGTLVLFQTDAAYCGSLCLVFLNQTVPGTSLVAQWLRIRLPMQETRVRALVQEDPTCHGATKPVHHTY